MEQRIDRRRVRTRAALIQAGQALFAQRSVDAVTIDDIVLAADVAKGSFYNHFPDKEGLAREVALEVRRAVEARAEEINAGVQDPAERAARALCLFARQAGENPEPVRAMMRLFDGPAVPDAPMNRGVRADIQAGLASGRFTGVTVETGVLMAVGLVQIAVLRVLQHERGGPARPLAEGLAFGLLRGLGVAEGEAAPIAARAAADLFEQRP